MSRAVRFGVTLPQIKRSWEEARDAALEFDRLNEAIRSAGSILMHYFGKQLHLTYKSSIADYRTSADVEAEQAIIEAIEKVFPDYNIIAEEHGTKEKNSQYTFVIDPLDGTNNFVLGLPAFASTVALLKNNEIIYAVIHHPVIGDLYHAMKGEGAFMNGRRISVNTEHRQSHITVSYYCDYITPRSRVVQFVSSINKCDC